MLRICAFVCSEKLEIRFSQLKSDLLRQKNTLFDVFDFVQELRDGTERHFILKKFFWKVRAVSVPPVYYLLLLICRVTKILSHAKGFVTIHSDYYYYTQ